nr:hypothetical protein [Tanacetum cinerariifolium]
EGEDTFTFVEPFEDMDLKAVERHDNSPQRDDYSRFTWVFFLANKDETSPILKTFITGLENQLSLNVKVIRSDNKTKFKNNDLNRFCRKKGIKREFSVPRTPQQNGIAERKNKTLIKATRTMLADLLIPIPFWVEVVNTTCYVQNRVLVTKPHNKTHYELLHGKFDGKVNEGFLVGYSVSSKAFRVFNSRTRIIQETLHVNFLENKPNVAGSGPTWLFDIDSLTRTMNYQPVTARNQSNPSAGFQHNFDAIKAGEEIGQKYVLFPVWSSGSTNPQNNDRDAAFDGKEPDFDAKKPEFEVNVSPSSSAQSRKQDDKTKKEAKGKSPVESLTRYRDLSAEFEDCSDNSINEVNDDGTLVPTVGQISPNSTNTFSATGTLNVAASPTYRKSSFINASQLPDDPDMPELEDITISDDEDDVGTEADFNNLETSITVSLIPTSRVHKDHPVTQIIVDLSSTTQTRSITKVVKDQGGLSSMFNDDFHTYMNKKDERGIMVRNKARLVAQGHTQEEGIDYEEVFALIARIEVFALYGLHQAPRAWLMIGSLMYLTSSRPDIMFAELKFNLFSVSQMCDKKNSVLFTDTKCLVLSPEFKLPDECQVLLRVPRENNMYSVNLKNIVPSGDLTCLFGKARIDESNLWHRRLGHVNFKTINKLVKGNLVIGLPTKVFENDNTCVACKKGKQHRASCKTKPVSSVDQPLYRLHTDLFGATFVKILNKKIYCLVVTDDYSRSGNGTEFKNNDLNQFFVIKGIQYSLLPIPFWAEAVNTACYVQNRVLVTKPHNKTPYELLHGRTLSISFMRPFGCHVTILITLDSLGKSESKVDEGFLVGYSVSSKAFRVFNSRTHIVQKTLHVNFLENKPSVAGSGPTWLFDIDSLTRTMNYQPVTAGNQTNPSASFQDKFAVEKAWEEIDKQYKPESEVNVSPSSSAQSSKQDDKTKKEAKGKSHVESFTGYRDLSAEFEDCSDNSINEVNVTEADFNNLETSISVSPIPTTRVHKDHLVTQIIGDLSSATQTRSMTREEGINYEEVFAPVARIEAIRLFLAYASFMGFMVYQMDVKSAFLYGTIEEKVYVCQPLGFEDLDHPDKVYKVVKALYGLHQAPRAWYETMANYLLENSFQRGKIDQPLFIKWQKGDILLVQIYVDDIIFGVTNKDLCKSFEKLMKDKFKMSSMGELTFFLGLQVKQKKDGIFISQDKYVAEILRKFGLTEGKSASTPIDIEKPLLKDPDGEDVDVHTYRLISWQCKKQTVVATSSTKAEYVAVARVNIPRCDEDRLELMELMVFLLPKVEKVGIGVNAVDLQVNDVTRLQALVDKKKVVVTEATIRQALYLDDADGVDCLLNKEIFTELARMGYEKPSTKLSSQASGSRKFNFSKYIFDSLVRNVDRPTKFYMYPCFLQLMIRKQVGNLSNHTTKYTSPALTQKVFANKQRVGKGFTRVETPLFESMLVEQHADEKGDADENVEEVNVGDAAEGDVQQTPPQSPQVQPPSHQPQPQQAAKFPMNFLRDVMDACAALTRRVLHLEFHKVSQALEITKLKRRVKKLERRNKVRVLKLRRLQRVGTSQRVETSNETVMDDVSNQRRMIAEVDADADVVLEDVKKAADEAKEVAEDAKVDENVDIQGRQAESQVEIYKIDLDHANNVLSMQEDETEPVEVQEVVDVVTTAKIITKDEVIDHIKIKAKEDLVVKKYQAIKRKPHTEAQGRKNMMLYIKNVVGFKMDYFKGMSYDDIHLIFKAMFNLNRAAKRRKLDEEVEELKRHFQIVPNEDDDVYTKATPLARKVPVVDYQIIEMNNKPYYKIIRDDNTHQLYPKKFSDDFLLVTLEAMFKKQDIHAQIWTNQRTVHGPTKVKVWKLLESCGLQIITFTSTQLILLVERKYPLTRFTLNQMLNAVSLEVEEESEVSLELLRFIRQQYQEGQLE